MIFLSAFVCLLMASCKPRTDMDMSQWGDHAFIDNVEIMKLEIDDEAKLQEYYENETPLVTTGARILIISEGKAEIDSVDFVARVKVKAGEKLDYAGLRIYHKGVKVEPISHSPKAGIVSDLSAKEFKYRLRSADGSKHDWKIVIE